MTDAEPVPDSLDGAIAEYLRRVDAGDAPDRAAFLAAHPSHADGLQSFFRDQDRFEPIVPVKVVDADKTLAPSDAGGTTSVIRYFGDYELLGEIARGGMGVVYRARQVSLNRVVALKMILAGNLANAADVQRFRAEAEAAANLDHPNILPIYEVGEHEGQHYFSMKLIEGGNLAGRIKKYVTTDHTDNLDRNSSVLSVPSVVKTLSTVARAVHYAHQRGILHRDLKPANILLDREGTPYVTDFGLAKRVEGDSGLTQSGAIVGTPSYMAPEQARAEKQLSTAVDVYSLGAILYECLTGRPPFRAATTLDTILQVLEQEPERPTNCDRDLATIALKCLEKQPAKRYDSVAALSDELERWGRGEPIVARPTGRGERVAKWVRRRPALAALSGAVALALVLGVWGTWAFVNQRRLSGQLAEIGPHVEAERAGLLEMTEGMFTGLVNVQKRTEATMRRSLYTDQSNLAQVAWKEGQIERVRELLEDMKPQPGNEDLRGFEWHYLHRLCQGGLRAFEGYPGWVDCVAFSSNGARVATASSDRPLDIRQRISTVRIWDAVTTRELPAPKASSRVRSIAFSPDGTRLAVGSETGGWTVDVWDLAGGQKPLVLRHADAVKAVAFSPDGTRVATSQYQTVLVWDAVTGREMLALKHDSHVYVVAFSADGNRLATHSIGDPLTTRIWDLATGRELLALKHVSYVHRLAFSPNGGRLATAEGGLTAVRTVRVWDLATGRELMGLDYVGSVEGMAFSPDGTRVTTVENAPLAGGWTARVRQLDTGQELATHTRTGWVHGAAFARDGTQLVTVVRRGRGGDIGTWNFRVWDVVAGPEALMPRRASDSPPTAPERPSLDFKLIGEVPPLPRIAFSPDGARFATATVGKSGTVQLWDVATGRLALTCEPASPANAVAFNSDGARLVTGGSGTAQSWDAGTGKELADVKLAVGSQFLAFSPDAKRLATTDPKSQQSPVIMWDIAGRREVLALPHKNLVQVGAFSANGTRLATASNDIVRVWDLATGRESLALNCSATAVGVAFSPDGSRLATSSANGECQVWDLSSGKQIQILRGHIGPVNAVEFSPDGSRIATACDDKTVRLWDPITGQQMLVLHQADRVKGLAFSRDGNRLASIAQDGTARVWDATPIRDK